MNSQATKGIITNHNSDFASEIDSYRNCSPKASNHLDTDFRHSLLRKFSSAKADYIARKTISFPEARPKLLTELLRANYRSYSEAEIDSVIDPLIEELRVGHSDLYAFVTEEQISDFAYDYSRLIQQLCNTNRSLARSNIHQFVTILNDGIAFTGIESPLPASNFASEIDREEIIAGLARLHCERWWKRKLRRLCFRIGEKFLRSKGSVGLGASPYISGISEARVKARIDASDEFLSAAEIESDLGDIVPMAEVVASSLANPRNRLSELYVRARGFDQIAEESGLSSYMLTITTPSRFHVRNANKDKSGSYPNPKFDGSTPSDGQTHLRTVWARIRAKAARQKIEVFGIRVAEAHHDGTPHWHLCIHVSQKQADEFIEICRSYACEDSPSELSTPRRLRARFDAELIDTSRGSPRSYLFKYLAKNLTGGVDKSDETGELIATEVPRVQRWASLWGIRQFQVFGSPSVTVWRELRRLREKDLSEVSAEQFAQIRDAACTGNWAEFVSLMGGVCVRREDQPVRPKKISVGENQYGEIVYQIRGLVMSHALQEIEDISHSIEVQTRNRTWRLISPAEVSRRNHSIGISTLGVA